MALTIVSFVAQNDATPQTTITVLFSEAVNLAKDDSDPSNPFDNSALNPNNYSLAALPDGTPINLGPAAVGTPDKAGRPAATFTLASLQPAGTWISVTVQNVTSGSDPSFVINDDGVSNFAATAVQAPAPAPPDPTAQAIRDISSYPVLTEEVGYPPSPLAAPAGVTAGAPGTQLGQAATKALSDVLGWKLKTDDPRGFVGALNQSFTLTDVEGHVEAKWTPRTYAVQTDLSGGITGAQASIYSRSKDALDQSLPLLDGLTALDPEADAESVAALRSVARSQLTEVVNELGTLGGPRVSRVNQYFYLLLGQVFPTTADAAKKFNVNSDPDAIPASGSLGNLRDEMGLSSQSNFVNSVEDEQDLTNYRILVDYTTSLAQSWVNNLRFFLRPTPANTQPFFGTQLVLISRQLSVVTESVNEVRFAMDSVFIGPAERQTLEIDFGSGAPSLFVEELLTWIEKFTVEEGPRYIQEGGKFAVSQSFTPVATQLLELVEGAQTPLNQNDLPDAYFSARVQRALQELADKLRELVQLSSPIGNVITPEPQPTQALAVLNVTPNIVASGQYKDNKIPVTIVGTGFKSLAKASFKSSTGAEIKPTTRFLSDNLLLANLDLSTASVDTYDVAVTNPDGRVAKLPRGFKFVETFAKAKTV